VTPTQAAAVLHGPISYNGHTYYLLTSDTWAASEALAVTLGGHLVTINDVDENEFIENTFMLQLNGGGAVWLGLTDAVTHSVEGTFVWTSGEPVTYTNWSSGNPNNGGGTEHFALMFQDINGSGVWNDGNDSDNPFNGVVEVETAIVGPGDTLVTDRDGSFDMIVVDLLNTIILPAGSYNATDFNYDNEFDAVIPSLGQVAGSITPLLMTGVEFTDPFVPVAIGATVPYSGPTAGFVSATFGGTNSFTLSSTTTVFAGFFWDATTLPSQMPIAFENLFPAPPDKSSFIRYSATGNGIGADPPSIGIAISGGAGDPVDRIYDFSIVVADDSGEPPVANAA
jgi:hypothetical protein